MSHNRCNLLPPQTGQALGQNARGPAGILQADLGDPFLQQAQSKLGDRQHPLVLPGRPLHLETTFKFLFFLNFWH